MPASMTGRQLAFYRELYAPFRPDELSTKPGRGNKEFTWLDKRALMNRLDTVCGPHGWYPEYRQFGPGLICALTIFCPDVTADGFVKVTKEDGAGPEEMTEVDNDIKSNFTNALRRSAQDAWGIGRYLYGKGIAGFLDPNAQAAPKGQAQSELEKPSAPVEKKPVTDSYVPPPPPEVYPPVSTARPDNGIPVGGMQIPKSGSGVWGWAKEIEKIFETRILDGMMDAGERLGFGRHTRSWDGEQTRVLCLDAIQFLRKLPNYRGQFEYLFNDQKPDVIDVLANVDNLQDSVSVPSYAADLLSAAKRALMNNMQALVEKQLGRKAEPSELKAALATVSPLVADEKGNTGEVCTSLQSETDLPWINNMASFVMKQIQSAQANAPDDVIPF